MSLMLDAHRIEAAVFDFDGVLADTASGWASAEAALCHHFGLDYTPALAASTHGVGLDDAVRILTATAQPQVPHEDASALMRDLALTHVPTDAAVIDGAVDSVRFLAGRVPVAIASNSERPLLEALVASLGFDGLVTAVVSASDVASPKPAPDVYLEAVRRLGAHPATTLAVEDSATGGTAAASAGCVVVVLDPTSVGPGRTPARWATRAVGSHVQLREAITPATQESSVTADDRPC